MKTSRAMNGSIVLIMSTDHHIVGHGEAAAKLQRDWGIDPQTLTFASRIKSHALVALIQKGLQYHKAEQSLSQVSGRCAQPVFPFP